MVDDSVLAEKDTLLEKLKNMKTEIKKRIKGYEEEIDLSLIAVAALGHVLYTGFPGLAKTLLAKTVAEVSGCGFNRIQLTPDLTPSDIRGTEIWRPNNQSFELYPGPIFTNIVLADEINRTPPKTQSAFLDAMQEKVVTIGNRTLSLPNPFMVFATRNPIEQEGIYPLPEAQLDRFLFEILFPYPTEEDEIEIAKQGNDDPVPVDKVWDPEGLVALGKFVSQNVTAGENVCAYIARFVRETRSYDPNIIELGASPRASQKFVAASKAHAFVVRHDTQTTPDDADAVARHILMPRLIVNPLNFHESDWGGLIDGIKQKARAYHIRS